VNDRSTTEGSGKLEHLVWKPRSAEEMHRLEELAQAAVGFDAKRGDQVVMENVSFNSNAPEMKPPAMDRVMEEARTLVHSQPGLMRTAMIGLCCALLVLFVLRPVARQVTATLNEPILLTAGANMGPGGALGMDGERMLAAEPELSAGAAPRALDQAPLLARSRANAQQQGIFDQVSEHIRRDPAQSTRLLEAWIGAQEEGE
jgi:flagellar M-ring protein FliF